MSAMKFNYREIVRCSNLRRENIVIILPSNSRDLSRSFNDGIGIFLQNKSTNDISKEEHQKIFSNYCSVLSTIGGPYTWSPPWYPDRCRFPCEPPTGCWLLANSSTVIYDSESSWWGLTVCGWDRFLKINFYCKWQSRTAAAAVRLGWVGVGGVVLSIGVSPRSY